ncbi:MAG: glycosyltransferase, partial [Planctomycetota bacterium]
MKNKENWIQEELPDPNAGTVLSRGQLIFGTLVTAALAACLWFDVTTSLLAVNLIVIIFYLIFAHYKLSLQFVSLHKRTRMLETGNIDNPDLPSYTIIIPLYKEASAVEGLTEHLKKLDYPQEKLQIMLLVEDDDPETAEAIAELNLSGPFEIVNIPVSMPKTKPKACNIALPKARGDYLVIYDAEDRPETDQLKKAIHLFSQSGKEVIC